jgi:DNA-binding transcriptional LysR family regulator
MSDADRWLGLELRHLVALKAVAEEGTFARAAARLGYTQSAVSQQIAALERIAGTRLLERPRGRRPTGPTQAGRILLRHADAMLARVQAVQADLTAADGVGELRVGTYQSIGNRVLPALLLRFLAAWPAVDVQLRESASDYELLGLVERGELDLTFCMLPPLDGPFATLELPDDPYVLVLPRDSPLAGKRRPGIREIASLPLVGFRSCRHEHRLEAQFRAHGHDPTVITRSDDNLTVQSLVAAGLGAALMPRLTVDFDHPGTVCIDVGDLFPARPLGIVWHGDRERTAVMTGFVDLAQAICAELDNGARDANARRRP